MSSDKRDRSVIELYNATELIAQIAPVSQGTSHFNIDDEKDRTTRTNMVSSQVEKKYGKRSVNRTDKVKTESGTCNVCSAPCSSCMHLNRPHIEPKTEETSDDRATMDSHYSVNAGDIKGRACENTHHAASEASNILSRDSFSENAESKINAVDLLAPKIEHEKPSDEFEESQGVEGHDDNISCVSRASGANVVVSSSNRDVENKIDSSENCSKVVDVDGSSPVMHTSKDKSECDGQLIGGSSEVSVKVQPKSEADIEKDGEKSFDEAVKGFDEAVKGSDEAEKSSESAELADAQEPTSQAESENESDESNTVEQDVKVCDICGDAGREDLLATCSRCTDGAEHTYCMRIMLQKVPEGDWLCEECQFAEDSESQRQGSGAEEKKTSKGSSIMQNSGKKRAGSVEVASSAKRQAIETSFESRKSSASLSRESSFKSLDKGKTRLPYSGNQSGNDIPESARSPTKSHRLQTLKGALTKSNSFSASNSKSKLKLIDEVHPQKLRGTKELSLKEVPTRMVGKSTSFKSSTSLNSSESKSKIVPSKSSLVQDLKGLRHTKDRNSFEKRPLSKLDRSLTCSAMATSTVSSPRTNQRLTPRGETNSIFHTSNSRESRRSDGKPSFFTKSNSISRKGVDHPASSVGASSANGNCSSAEEKLNQVNLKDEPLQDDVSRSVEPINQVEKSKDSSSSRSKTVISADLKNALCQKCKEVGRATENCSVCSEIIKSNNLKAAIEAALQKVPGKFAKNKAPGHSDRLPVPSLELNREKASQDQPFLNKIKTMVSGEGTYEGKLNLQPVINNAKQLNVHATDSFGYRDSDRVVSSIEKPVMRDGPSYGLAMVSSAIPDHEYIWQGAFEVHRAERHDLCDGIQAHLSTGAAPKVVEVVNKFSSKMPMVEVPRLCSWPTQFKHIGAKENNIAFYFFAKDVESYEKNYKVLVDNMIKSDLALIANFDDVELLIFPSNLLPENCQRWNMLYFLWGVCRGRKVSSQKSSLPKLDNKELSLHDGSDTAAASNIPDGICAPINKDCGNRVPSLEQKAVAGQGNLEKDRHVPGAELLSNNEPSTVKICSEARCTSPSLEEVGLPESKIKTDAEPLTETGIGIGYERADRRKMPVHVPVFREGHSPSKHDAPVISPEVGLVENVKEISSDRTTTDGSQLKERKVKDKFLDLGTVTEIIDLEEKEPIPSQPNQSKRSHSDLVKTAAQTSTGFTPKFPLDDLNCVFVDDDDIVSKKLKTDFSELRSSRDGNFAAPVKDVGCSSLVDFKFQDKALNKEVIIIPEDPATGEEYLFPVKSQLVDNFQLGNTRKRLERERFQNQIPNLNLAIEDETNQPELGAEIITPSVAATNKGILPFLVGSASKDSHPGKSTDEKDLSLSLSFPFLDKEKNPKPVPETGESRPANTPLLLFGNILKK
ncbi:hypothetical protein ACFE04_028669 [Oxalis oulophora]